MKAVSKKLLSLLLVLMLLVSVVPFSAMAAEGETTSKTITIVLIRETDGVDETITKGHTTDYDSLDVMTLAAVAGSTEGFTFVRYDAGAGQISTPGNVTIVDGMTLYIRVAKTTTNGSNPGDTTGGNDTTGGDNNTGDNNTGGNDTTGGDNNTTGGDNNTTGGNDNTQMGGGATTSGTSVKFIVDGVEYATIAQTEGETAGLPATPYKTGYSFEGWFSKQNGEGHRIYNGVTWYDDSYATTYYAHFVSNKVVDNNTIRIFVQAYVGDVLRSTREIDSVLLETGENAFNWLYYNKDRIDSLIDAAYPGYNWAPQLYYDYTGTEPLTEQNLTANGTKSVCVKIHSNVEANVLLYVHKGKATATPAIYEMPGYVKDDTVSRTAVQTLVKKYYTGSNMVLEGLYNDEAWQDLLEGKAPTAANGVTVDSNGTVRIHVILKNASNSTADPSNPKTGDYILPAAMTVMVLSGLAAAAAYVFGKKRV